MANDVLANALRAEGLGAEAIGRVYEALGAEHLSIMVPPWVQDRLNRETLAAERKAAAEKERSAAVAYKGEIKYCQSSTYQGRSGSFRCGGKAGWVVRRAEQPSLGDGRLAVCRTHRDKPDAARFINVGWQLSIYGPGATEVVEAEYQPA